MDTSTPTINKVLFIVCGGAFAIPGLFFTYLTVRLIHLNLTMDAAAASNRTLWMLVWGIAFPVAAIMLGGISRYFFRKALKVAPNQ